MVEKLMGGEEHLGDTNTEPQAQTAALTDKVLILYPMSHVIRRCRNTNRT